MTLAEAYRYFRGFTEEWDETAVPSSGSTTRENIQDYLQRAAEWLNDAIGYSFKDGTLTLAAGTDAALPTDLIEVVYVTLDHKKLDRTDLEALATDFPGWQGAEQNLPSHYYVYSKIGFYPPLSSEAAGLTGRVRYIGTPTLEATAGFELLSTAHHRIPLYYAVGLWLEAHGELERSTRFMKRAEAEAALVKDYYRKRREGG